MNNKLFFYNSFFIMKNFFNFFLFIILFINMKNAIIKDIIYDNEKEKLVIILDNKDYYYTNLSQKEISNKSRNQKVQNEENLIDLLKEHCSNLQTKNFFNKETKVNLLNEYNIHYDLKDQIKAKNSIIIQKITSSIKNYELENKIENNSKLLILKTLLNYIKNENDKILFYQIKKYHNRRNLRNSIFNQSKKNENNTHRLSQFTIGDYVPTKQEVYFIRTFCHCNNPEHHKTQLDFINYKIPDKVLNHNSYCEIHIPKTLKFSSMMNNDLNNNDNLFMNKTVKLDNNKFKYRIKSAIKMKNESEREKIKLIGFKENKIKKKFKINSKPRYDFFTKSAKEIYLKELEIEKKVNPKQYEILEKRERIYDDAILRRKNNLIEDLKKKGLYYKKINSENNFKIN